MGRMNFLAIAFFLLEYLMLATSQLAPAYPQLQYPDHYSQTYYNRFGYQPVQDSSDASNEVVKEHKEYETKLTVFEELGEKIESIQVKLSDQIDKIKEKVQNLYGILFPQQSQTQIIDENIVNINDSERDNYVIKPIKSENVEELFGEKQISEENTVLVKESKRDSFINKPVVSDMNEKELVMKSDKEQRPITINRKKRDITDVTDITNSESVHSDKPFYTVDKTANFETVPDFDVSDKSKYIESNRGDFLNSYNDPTRTIKTSGDGEQFEKFKSDTKHDAMINSLMNLLKSYRTTGNLGNGSGDTEESYTDTRNVFLQNKNILKDEKVMKFLVRMYLANSLPNDAGVLDMDKFNRYLENFSIS